MNRPTNLVDSRKADAAAVLFAATFPSLATWVYFIAAADSAAAVQQLAAASGKVIQFGFPILWVLWLRRDRLHWNRPSRAGLGTGLAFGLVVFVTMLAAYHLWLEPSGFLDPAGEEIARKVAKFGIRSPGGFVALGIFYSLAHSLLEEYYWRWFVFGEMRRLMPWPAAAAISSLAFMAHHVIVLGTYLGWASCSAWLFSLCVAVGGAVWCWIYQRSGSLLGPWLSHLLIDAAIFVVGYRMMF